MGNQTGEPDPLTEEHCKMDSLQPILPSERIHLHGIDRSGNGETQTKTQESTRLEILDEKILFKSGSFEKVKRWIKGKHPTLGQIMWGFTGWETVQEYSRIVPMGTFTVIDVHE